MNTVSRRGKTQAGNDILMYYSHTGDCLDKMNSGLLLYVEMSTNSFLGSLYDRAPLIVVSKSFLPVAMMEKLLEHEYCEEQIKQMLNVI